MGGSACVIKMRANRTERRGVAALACVRAAHGVVRARALTRRAGVRRRTVRRGIGQVNGKGGREEGRGKGGCECVAQSPRSARTGPTPHAHSVIRRRHDRRLTLRASSLDWTHLAVQYKREVKAGRSRGGVRRRCGLRRGSRLRLRLFRKCVGHKCAGLNARKQVGAHAGGQGERGRRRGRVWVGERRRRRRGSATRRRQKGSRGRGRARSLTRLRRETAKPRRRAGAAAAAGGARVRLPRWRVRGARVDDDWGQGGAIEWGGSARGRAGGVRRASGLVRAFALYPRPLSHSNLVVLSLDEDLRAQRGDGNGAGEDERAPRCAALRRAHKSLSLGLLSRTRHDHPPQEPRATPSPPRRARSLQRQTPARPRRHRRRRRRRRRRPQRRAATPRLPRPQR